MMTIEQKAKRYDDAITKARNIVNSINVGLIGKDSFEAVFPELKESEDEKIRKALRERIINYDPNNEILIKEEGISQKQFLAWIEKQGQVRCTGVGKKEATGVLKEMLDDEGMKEQKQEWSEEDENTRKKIIKFLKEQNYFDGKANEFKEPYKKEYEWLKSLRHQSQWKPSNEQIEILDMVLTNESMDDNVARILRELREQLKKLKE